MCQWSHYEAHHITPCYPTTQWQAPGMSAVSARLGTIAMISVHGHIGCVIVCMYGHLSSEKDKMGERRKYDTRRCGNKQTREVENWWRKVDGRWERNVKKMRLCHLEIWNFVFTGFHVSVIGIWGTQWLGCYELWVWLNVLILQRNIVFTILLA